MLAVQVIEILWTKATRGAPRSNERAALPRAFPFTAEPAVCVVQRFRLAEWENEFSPRLLTVEAMSSLPSSEGVLLIQGQSHGSFRLGFLGTPNAGQPKRKAIVEAFALLAGQYARLAVNARHTAYSGQWYSETIYNIACGTRIAVDRFLQGPPEHDLDLKDKLF